MSKPSSRSSRPPRPSDLVRGPLLTDHNAPRTIREKVNRSLRRVTYDRRDEHELVDFLYAKEQITDEIDELDERRDRSAISRREYDESVNDAKRRQSTVQKEIDRRTSTQRTPLPPPPHASAPRSRPRSHSRSRSRSRSRHPPPPYRHVILDRSGGADSRSRRHGAVELKPAAVVRAEEAVRVQTTESAEPSQTTTPPPQTTTPQPPTITPQPPSVAPVHQHTHDPNTEEVDGHEDEEQQGDSEEQHGDHEEQQGVSEEQQGDHEEQQEAEQVHEATEGEQENEQNQQDDHTPHPAPSLPPGVHPVDLAPHEQLKPFVHSVDQLFFTGIWLCSNCTHRSVRGGTIQQGGEAEFWFQRPACCANCQKAQPTAYPHLSAPVVVLGPWDLVLDFTQTPPVRLDEEAVKARCEHIVNLAK